MATQPSSYLKYTKKKHIFEALKYWPAQLYLFVFIVVFCCTEHYSMFTSTYYLLEKAWLNRIVFWDKVLLFLKNGSAWQYLLFLFALLEIMLLILYAFARKRNVKICIKVLCVLSFACILWQFIQVKSINKNIEIEWLYLSLIFVAISITSFPASYVVRQGPFKRFLALGISVVSYVLAICMALAKLPHSNIYTWCAGTWTSIWDVLLKSFHRTDLPNMENWISVGLTLLTGCLIVLSWSPGIAHDEWNPYPSYKLESPARRALMALGFLVVVIYSILAKWGKITLLAFFLLLATDLTIMIYCYVMQTETHVCTLLAKYIVHVSPSYMYYSTPSSLYHKMSRVSQHIIESGKLNTVHEKGAKMICVLNEVVASSEKIIKEGSAYDKADWAFAIGLACMPSGRSAECSIYTMRTYFYDVFDYVYMQTIDPPHLMERTDDKSKLFLERIHKTFGNGIFNTMQRTSMLQFVELVDKLHTIKECFHDENRKNVIYDKQEFQSWSKDITGVSQDICSADKSFSMQIKSMISILNKMEDFHDEEEFDSVLSICEHMKKMLLEIVNSTIGQYVLYGLLMGAVRLCAKDHDWRKEFGFGNQCTDYQHCLRLICPT